MFQPRYAPRRARLTLPVTRTVTSAAVLAALALVCGPALERTCEPAAAAAGAARTTGPADSSSAAATEPAVGWHGALAIRPSKIAKAPAAGTADVALIEATPAGPPGEIGALGIPLMVLRAYHLAADQLGTEQPSCKLPWWLLAGIGHTESGHAEAGRLTADGTTRGRILGPPLNGGIPGDAIITDTDHGSLDGDTVYDRAVGPMQFIPSTWVHWGPTATATARPTPATSSTPPWPPPTTCAPTAATCPPRPAYKPRCSATTTRRRTWRRCWPGARPTATAPRRCRTARCRWSAT